MTFRPHHRVSRHGIASLFVAASLIAAPMSTAAVAQTVMPDVLVKAAFVFNFAKFTEWPSLPPGARLVVCVVDDDDLAASLVTTIHGQQISGRAIEVARPRDQAAWTDCHLLFVTSARVSDTVDGLAAVRTRQVLTISDGKGFARSGGIIEFYVEAGRMRFAINPDAADRAGLRISSRLLGLAKVVRDNHAQ